MNENLSDIVKTATPEEPLAFSEENLDIPAEETATEEQPSGTIGITTLSSWFSVNSENFDNINQVRVSIRGVDPDQTLIMAVKDGSGEQDEDGNDKRVLRIFENADVHPVLDLPGIDMQSYNNGFRIIHDYGQNNIFIKCYGVRTGLIVVFCNNIDGKLIPYVTTRVKKKDTEITISSRNISEVQAKMMENADLEALQLLYKQSSKAVEDMATNQDVVNWLLERQEEVTDINHHLQIDGVIIDMLK